MHRMRRLLIAIALGTSAVLTPAVVSADTAVTYTLAGAEIAATESQGTFVGVAWAPDDVARWKAVVVHAPLPTEVGGTAAVTGGSFALDGRARDLGGTINPGGVITFVAADSGCGRQWYSVAGQVTVAGLNTAASFGVLLTHFRLRIFGVCRTIFATVRGSVTFNLP